MDKATKYFAVPQGRVYIADRNSTGKTSQFTHVGNVSGLSFNTAQTFFEDQESMTGLRSTVVRIPTAQTYTFSMEMKNIDKDNLAKAYQGTGTSSTGATVTGEAINARPGERSYVKRVNISAVVIKKGATTLVAGTDYIVDTVYGAMDFLTSANIITGDNAVTVDYTYATQTSVQGMTVGQKDYALRFEGMSKFDSLPVVVNLPRVSLDLSASLALIGTGATILTVGGLVLPAPEITTAGLSQYIEFIEG